MKRIISLMAVLVFSTFTVSAQLIAEYTFGSGSFTQTKMPSFVYNNLLSYAGPVEVGSSQTHGFTTGNPNGRSRLAQNWTTSNVPDLDQHFRFTLTKNASSSVTITRIEFDEKRNTDGPLNIQIRTSADGFASVLWEQSIPNNTDWRSWSILTSLPISSSLEIRLCAFNSVSSVSGSWMIDNVRIYAEETVLPIELLDFSGKESGDDVELSWTTLTERDNDYFTVLRSSDATNWQEVGRVSGAGTSYAPLTYRLVDENPFTGINFYKLRQTDFDETFVDSRIISVEFTESEMLIAFPNPVKTRERFNASQKINFAVDGLGKVLSTEDNIIYVAGTYTLVHVNENGSWNTFRLTVTH
ncbi:MAG: hypothetical protein R3B65_02250 [Candidatus Paceibacterota bacterium]